MSRLRILVPLFALVAALGIATPAGAGDTCSPVSGNLVEHLTATGSAGTVDGDLEGDYEFTLTSLTQKGQSPVNTFTGTSTITTADGTITADDSGVLNTKTDNIVWRSVITGGTGAYSNANGQLHYGGTLDFDTGQGSAVYHGNLCTFSTTH